MNGATLVTESISTAGPGGCLSLPHTPRGRGTSRPFVPRAPRGRDDARAGRGAVARRTRARWRAPAHRRTPSLREARAAAARAATTPASDHGVTRGISLQILQNLEQQFHLDRYPEQPQEVALLGAAPVDRPRCAHSALSRRMDDPASSNGGGGASSSRPRPPRSRPASAGARRSRSRPPRPPTRSRRTRPAGPARPSAERPTSQALRLITAQNYRSRQAARGTCARSAARRRTAAAAGSCGSPGGSA